MQLTTKEIEKFDQVIIDLYNQIETNPANIIKVTDTLIKYVKNEADPNNIKWNKMTSLHNLRAETFYKMGKYDESITEIYNDAKNDTLILNGELYIGDNSSIHLACNYVKTKNYKKAKQYLDNANKGWYITNYIWANYFEVINDTTKAINTYNKILKENNKDHYSYYSDSQKRINELKKPNPQLLNELYYPSDRPDNNY